MKLRNIFNVTGGTLLSRLLGFVREATIAFLLGGKDAADAFYVAFRIPNLLRDIFAENAMQTAFIPTFIESKTKGLDEQKFVKSVFTIFAVILTLIVGLGILFTPLFVKLLAFGFTKNHAKFLLTTRLTRITFPFLLFISFSAIEGGILNSFKKFFIPAISPVFHNIIVISSGLLAYYIARNTQYAYYIAAGVVTGGTIQFLFQYPFMKKTGMNLGLTLKIFHPELKKFFKLLVPVILNVSFVNLTLLVNTQIASFLEKGSVAYLSYAFRVMHLPVALFGVSVATVAMPSLSEKYAKGENIAEEYWRGIEYILLLMIPAVIFLLKDTPAVVQLIYQRGNFHAIDTLKVSQALAFYALAVLPLGINQISMNVYFSRHLTKVPNILFGIGAFLNIAFALILSKYLSFAGIALASAITISIRALVLMFLISKEVKSPYFFLGDTLKITGISLLFFAFITYFNPLSSMYNMLIHLLIGSGIYIILARVMGLINLKASRAA